MATKATDRPEPATRADPQRETHGATRTAIRDLVYQVLEAELGGVQVYRAALRCAVNPDLRKEWEHYLRQTERHVQIARRTVESLGMDPELDVVARMPVRTIGLALVSAIEQGIASGDPVAAQLTAADCVVAAEVKDHQNWSLLGKLAGSVDPDVAAILRAAADEVEPEEDHHQYHSMGWSRELWLDALGVPAVLPPQEERQHVGSAEDAAQAKKDRKAARTSAARAAFRSK
ncbi:MAG: hypothetical protein ABMB14_21125 [Myxococcota bacterium]